MTNFVYMCIMFMCVGKLIPQCMCECWKTSWRSYLPPVTTWVSGIKLRSLGLLRSCVTRWAVLLALQTMRTDHASHRTSHVSWGECPPGRHRFVCLNIGAVLVNMSRMVERGKTLLLTGVWALLVEGSFLGFSVEPVGISPLGLLWGILRQKEAHCTLK